MLKRPDIIIFTLFRTDSPYSSISLRLAKVWAKESRVFYINPPYTFKDVWEQRKDPAVRQRMPSILSGKVHYEKSSEIPDNFISVVPPAMPPINWLPEGVLYDSLWKRNNKVILNTIKQVIKDYDIKEYIFFNCFNPYYAPVLPAAIKPLLHIYHCIDDIAEEPYTAKHGPRHELKTVRNADIVTVTAHQLKRKYEHSNPNIHILHNAVDISIFRQATEKVFPKPVEFRDRPGKVIGFFGNLDHVRIDYALLKKVAEHHTDKLLVLVGPVTNQEIYTIGLDKLPNVILTGSKPHDVLPQYLQHFDCAIIPFQLNKNTASIYPLKINEYLAAGKAIVSTSFSEDIKSFSDCIYLAKSYADFILLIDKAIVENDPQIKQQRIDLALRNTWDARVREFWNILDEYKIPALHAPVSPTVSLPLGS